MAKCKDGKIYVVLQTNQHSSVKKDDVDPDFVEELRHIASSIPENQHKKLKLTLADGSFMVDCAKGDMDTDPTIQLARKMAVVLNNYFILISRTADFTHHKPNILAKVNQHFTTSTINEVMDPVLVLHNFVVQHRKLNQSEVELVASNIGHDAACFGGFISSLERASNKNINLHRESLDHFLLDISRFTMPGMEIHLPAMVSFIFDNIESADKYSHGRVFDVERLTLELEIELLDKFSRLTVEDMAITVARKLYSTMQDMLKDRSSRLSAMHKMLQSQLKTNSPRSLVFTQYLGKTVPQETVNNVLFEVEVDQEKVVEPMLELLERSGIKLEDGVQNPLYSKIVDLSILFDLSSIRCAPCPSMEEMALRLKSKWLSEYELELKSSITPFFKTVEPLSSEYNKVLVILFRSVLRRTELIEDEYLFVKRSLGGLITKGCVVTAFADQVSNVKFLECLDDRLMSYAKTMAVTELNEAILNDSMQEIILITSRMDNITPEIREKLSSFFGNKVEVTINTGTTEDLLELLPSLEVLDLTIPKNIILKEDFFLKSPENQRLMIELMSSNNITVTNLNDLYDKALQKQNTDLLQSICCHHKLTNIDVIPYKNMNPETIIWFTNFITNNVDKIPPEQIVSLLLQSSLLPNITRWSLEESKLGNDTTPLLINLIDRLPKEVMSDSRIYGVDTSWNLPVYIARLVPESFTKFWKEKMPQKAKDNPIIFEKVDNTFLHLPNCVVDLARTIPLPFVMQFWKHEIPQEVKDNPKTYLSLDESGATLPMNLVYRLPVLSVKMWKEMPDDVKNHSLTYCAQDIEGMTLLDYVTESKIEQLGTMVSESYANFLDSSTINTGCNPSAPRGIDLNQASLHTHRAV